jgi:hypothetical protein
MAFIFSICRKVKRINVKHNNAYGDDKLMKRKHLCDLWPGFFSSERINLLFLSFYLSEYPPYVNCFEKLHEGLLHNELLQ